MKSLIQRLRRLDHLIRHRGTGSPATLAKKIGISERSLYDYLKLLKDMGAPISYSRDKGSYYYKEHGSFHIAFHECDPLIGPNYELTHQNVADISVSALSAVLQ
jgi:biotin operon repressor